MTDQEKIELLKKLTTASQGAHKSYYCGRSSRAKWGAERIAARRVLEELLGRKPTDAELESAMP